MLPPDYINAVLADYYTKKAANQLPFDMKQLSPARFKAASLEVGRERYDKKDERLLKAFFGEAADQKACLKAIDECKIDKFKPLINFLREKTTTRTDDKNVELLAWLINFKDRPCEYGKKYSADTAPDIPKDPPVDRQDNVQPKVPGDGQDEPKTKPGEPEKVKGNGKKVVITFTIVVALGMTVYWFWPKSSAANPGPQACMYWAGDHYQPIRCDKKLDNTLVIALDSDKIVHFIKIAYQDSITFNAIGHVWYAKYRGNMEFYTSDGFHPIDPGLRLKPITPYIIRKYIRKENIAEDSVK